MTAMGSGEGGGGMSAEVRAEVARVDRILGLYQQFVEQRMIEDVKLKAKLDGFPTTWMMKEQVLKAEGLQALVGKAVDAEVWVRKDGTGVGVAMVTFGSVGDRRAVVQEAKELKLELIGRKIYMNHAKTEMEERKDKPLLKAWKEVKSQWQGDRDALRLKFGDERNIRASGRVFAEQNPEMWEMRWKVPKEEILTEQRVHAARSTE